MQGYNKTDGNYQAGLNTVRWMTDYLLKIFMPDPNNGTPDAPEFIVLYQVQPAGHHCNGTWSLPLSLVESMQRHHRTTRSCSSFLSTTPAASCMLSRAWWGCPSAAEPLLPNCVQSRQVNALCLQGSHSGFLSAVRELHGGAGDLEWAPVPVGAALVLLRECLLAACLFLAASGCLAAAVQQLLTICQRRQRLAT